MQNIQQGASSSADGSGNITVRCLQIPSGWLADLSVVPQAGGAIQWEAQVSGATVGYFVGGSTGGPFRVIGPLELSLVASGLTAGLDVPVQVSGAMYRAFDAPPPPPLNAQTTATATISGTIETNANVTNPSLSVGGSVGLNVGAQLTQVDGTPMQASGLQAVVVVPLHTFNGTGQTATVSIPVLPVWANSMLINIAQVSGAGTLIADYITGNTSMNLTYIGQQLTSSQSLISVPVSPSTEPTGYTLYVGDTLSESFSFSCEVQAAVTSSPMPFVLSSDAIEGFIPRQFINVHSPGTPLRLAAVGLVWTSNATETQAPVLVIGPMGISQGIRIPAVPQSGSIGSTFYYTWAAGCGQFLNGSYQVLPLPSGFVFPANAGMYVELGTTAGGDAATLTAWFST